MNSELLSDMIQLEIDTLKSLFKVNGFKLINEQKNYRNIKQEYDNKYMNETIIFKNVFSDIEYIFKNDKINIYFKYSDTHINKCKAYELIVRITDNQINMTNLCVFEFDDLSKNLSKINEFLFQSQVFINSYKKLIGEK